MGSVEQLVEQLDKKYFGRRQELTALDLTIKKADSETAIRALLRASVPLIYSHWEGFIKESAGLYVKHVCSQNRTGSELKSNFTALAVKKKMLETLKSRKTSEHESLVKEIMRLLNEPLPHADALIDTESNLSSAVLQEVFRSIGLSFGEFWEIRSEFIDREMVNRRNEIAHGTMRPVTREEYDELSDFIEKALKQFKESIEEAALNKVYLKETMG